MKKTRPKTKKPNGVIYFMAYVLLYPVLKLFFGLRVDKTAYEPPKGPFIAVCNHQSFMDFLLAMLPFYPRRMNAVAAQKYFYFKPLDKLLPLMGCIPKNLFDADARSVKQIMSVIRRGGRVLLFPEGRGSTDGVYAGINKATAKLIKKLGVPVVGCRIEGSYNCMPFWRKGIRRGRMSITLKNLFSAEDTKRLALDELNEGIDAALGGEIGGAVKKPLGVFREKRLAEGLENILYLCPACLSEFTLASRSNAVSCASCGAGARLDRFGNLHPDAGSVLPLSIHEWYKAQASYELRRLDKAMAPVRVRVILRMRAEEGSGMAEVGSGELSLDAAGWRYKGLVRGGEAELFFPLETVPAVPFDPLDNFQIYSGGKIYVFTPIDDARASVKYSVLGECTYWKFSPSPQMTPGFDSGMTNDA